MSQWNHNVVLRLLSREASSLQADIRDSKRFKARAWALAVPGTAERQHLLTYKKQLKQVNACIKAIKQGNKKPSKKQPKPQAQH